MNGFSSTLTDFCAGKETLDRVMAALEGELAYNSQSRASSSSLIEFAWRTGKIDQESYSSLRSIVEERVNPDFTAPVYSGWHEKGGSQHAERSRSLDAYSRDENNDETKFRPGGLTRPSVSRPVSSIDGAAPRHQGDRNSQPSASSGWLTNPSQWSEAGAVKLSAGSVLKERFELEEIIGRGGMGVVFRAKDRRKEEAQDRFPYVAVKVLNEDFRRHPDSLKALQREARKAQSLAHENVAAVYDFDRDGESVFLVMELLEGASLEKVIKDRSRRGLPRNEMLRIVRGLGAALAYAHEKGVVHCDFKPANCFRCNDGSIKVFDFGIARAIRRRNLPPREQTQFDAGSLGALTPAYASCELLLGEDPDPRDDVFALACVAYELLTGTHPFEHSSALIAERRGMKPPPIEGLDRRTWRALVRGLTFVRKERTASVDAFVEELAPSRHRAALVAAAGVTFAAIGATAWFYVPGLRSAQVAQQPQSAPSSVAKAEAPEVADTSAGTDLPIASAQVQPAAVDQMSSGAPERVTSSTQLTAEQINARIQVARQGAAQQAYGGDNRSVMPSGTQLPEKLIVVSTGAGAAVVDRKEPKAATPSQVEDLRTASVEVLKRQLLSSAGENEIAHAVDALHALESRLPPDDEYLRKYAPQQIARAYARLGEQALARGDFDTSASLFERAQEMASDKAEFSRRQEQVNRTRILGRLLESGTDISAESLTAKLAEVSETEGPSGYPEVRRHLANLFATRIEAEQQSSPQRANEHLRIAQQVFPGAVAIESLQPVAERTSNAVAIDARSQPTKAPAANNGEALAASPP